MSGLTVDAIAAIILREIFDDDLQYQFESTSCAQSIVEEMNRANNGERGNSDDENAVSQVPTTPRSADHSAES